MLLKIPAQTEQEQAEQELEPEITGDLADWKHLARETWRSASLIAEEKRLAADRAYAERVVVALADCDPPIIARPMGRRAEADGALFEFYRYDDDENNPRLTMLRKCDECGETVSSKPLNGWEDIGECLDVPVGLNGPEIYNPWPLHWCPQPDPADLVSVLRHVLLFAYDHHTGEPKLPIYAIRRAEDALAAFEAAKRQGGPD